MAAAAAAAAAGRSRRGDPPEVPPRTGRWHGPKRAAGPRRQCLAATLVKETRRQHATPFRSRPYTSVRAAHNGRAASRILPRRSRAAHLLPPLPRRPLPTHHHHLPLPTHPLPLFFPPGPPSTRSPSPPPAATMRLVAKLAAAGVAAAALVLSAAAAPVVRDPMTLEVLPTARELYLPAAPPAGRLPTAVRVAAAIAPSPAAAVPAPSPGVEVPSPGPELPSPGPELPSPGPELPSPGPELPSPSPAAY